MKRPKDEVPGSPQRTWFWLGITAVAIIALIARWALYLEQRSFAMLQRAYDLILTTDELVSNLGDVEENAVAYLSTGRENYRLLMDASREAVERKADLLATLSSATPERRARIERLRPLLTLELDDIEKKVRDRNLPGLIDRGYSVHSGGQRPMLEVRNIIGEMEAQEHAALARFSGASQSRQETGLAALAGSALLASCCLLLGQTILNRNISRRMKAEEGLSVSEKRFELLCNSAPVGIYETDSKGFCVYTNPRWTEMSGLTTAESLGHGWTKVVQPDDREQVFKDWQKAVSHGASWEYRLTKPGGDVRWIRALGVPIHTSQGAVTGYMGTLEDITEKQLAARALQDREALNRAVLNSLPACIAVLKSEGTVQTANESWQKMANEDVKSPCFVETGANYLDRCQQMSAAGSPAMTNILVGIQEVLHGQLPKFEMQYPSRIGIEKRWFHLLVTPLSSVSEGGAVIVYLDITRRKQAEERFRSVVEAAPTAFVVTGENGGIRLVNSRAEALFGYSRQELRGRSIQSLVPGFILKPVLSNYPAPEGECTFAVRRNGTQVPVEMDLSTIETAEGLWILSSIVDITERRNADLALRASRQELRALAGRLINAQEEERRRISRQLHDDLSQKLALLAFDASNLLLSSPASQDGLREGLVGLKTRVVQLAQDVRQIAHQLHPAILEDLGLTAALTELCDEFSLREGIEARCEHEAIAEEIPKEVAASLYGIAQEALHNILKHARASHVLIRVASDKRGIHFSVRDDGVGFDEQAASARHGLGIISMKERARLVQGEFSIRASRGAGCEINVFVPFAGALR